MASDGYLRFNGITEIGDSTITEQLKGNLKSWLDWAFLNVGAFTNINVPTTGQYGGLNHRLRLTSDQNYTSGEVWQGFRQDWVWETGIDYRVQPTRASGVIVNGTFYPTLTTTGTYAHRIEYPNGRVVFNNPISSSSVVTLNYSYRNIQTQIADNTWFLQSQFRSFRADDTHFSQAASGDWFILAETRAQMPCIIMNVVPRRQSVGYELGHIKNWVYNDVWFYVLAEDSWWRSQILDILGLQKDKTILLFDVNQVASGRHYSLDIYGGLVTGEMKKMYPSFITDHAWKHLRFHDVTTANMDNWGPNLFAGYAHATCEVVL